MCVIQPSRYGYMSANRTRHLWGKCCSNCKQVTLKCRQIAFSQTEWKLQTSFGVNLKLVTSQQCKLSLKMRQCPPCAQGQLLFRNVYNSRHNHSWGYDHKHRNSNQIGTQILLICLLLFSTCFGQLCAHHLEKIPYLCDTWYLMTMGTYFTETCREKQQTY